ncbi:MAG: tRNA pseudouridine(38-40) synthase TruA [Lachnospiraceae bacterium]
MKRVKMVIAYDGTNYCGWQLQPNGVTIEQVLNEKLSELLHEPIAVIGASRTDSGVHALGNVAVFDTESRIPAQKMAMALNQRLPKDIVVQSSCEVPLDYHPRKRNTHKTYEYRILNRRIPLPAERFNSLFYYMPLNLEAMQKAAACLVGEHDFVSFCSVRNQAEDTVRTIYSLDIKKDEKDMIYIRITGNGFLYNMIRIIVGTLLRVGTGYYSWEQINQILEARDRNAAGPKAPAEGLTLIQIEEVELEPFIVQNTLHWSYCLQLDSIADDGTATLHIMRCDKEDFSRTLLRLTKYAFRNGCRKIFVMDDTGFLTEEMELDYFIYRKENGNFCGYDRADIEMFL